MRSPDEMIDQGALDLRALGFHVDSNARPAPAAEATPVLDALDAAIARAGGCLLYTSPSPRDATLSRMPSSA